MKVIVIDTDVYKRNMDSFNRDMVDIHCRLVDNTQGLIELQKIQEDLDNLTSEFSLFSRGFFDKYDLLIKCLEDKRKKYFIKSKCYALLALIPIVGTLLAIYLIIKSYNSLLEVKKIAENMEIFANEFHTSTDIFWQNVQLKYDFLNKKLLQFTGNHSKEDERNNHQNYTYYNASEMIINYLDNFDLDVEDIEPSVKVAMIRLLQRDLETDCNDIRELLNMAKEKNSSQVKLMRTKNL